jgi:hypothetical protein
MSKARSSKKATKPISRRNPGSKAPKAAKGGQSTKTFGVGTWNDEERSILETEQRSLPSNEAPVEYRDHLALELTDDSTTFDKLKTAFKKPNTSDAKTEICAAIMRMQNQVTEHKEWLEDIVTQINNGGSIGWNLILRTDRTKVKSSCYFEITRIKPIAAV